MVTCNSCADILKKLHDAKRDIYRLYTAYDRAPEDERKSGFGSAVRSQLERATRRYAEAVCTSYNVQTVWDYEFVELLLQHPSHAEATLTDYRCRVAKLSESGPTELPLGDLPVGPGVHSTDGHTLFL